MLGDLRAAARQPTNLSKVSQVVQGKKEPPGAFLECLLDAYPTYTPLDPEAPENQMAINLAFINQAAPDIKIKLQWFNGFEGKNLSKSMAIATKVYTNREAPEDRQTRGLAKVLLAADRAGALMDLGNINCSK